MKTSKGKQEISCEVLEQNFGTKCTKATIEQSLNSQAASVNPSTIGIGFQPTQMPMPMPIPIPIPMTMTNRNLYLNPWLQQRNSLQSGQQWNEEIKRVINILLRTKKKNPVLVGESEPAAVTRELPRRIEKGELSEGTLKNLQVIPIEKELTSDRTQIPAKIKELADLIESRIGNSNGGGVILDLGDLKWLLDQPVSFGVPGSGGVPQQVVSDTGRAAVGEMGRLLARFGEGSSCRLWVIGTATCETYLRCLVYHPSMENDWDLQALPIVSRSHLPGMFPSFKVASGEPLGVESFVEVINNGGDIGITELSIAASRYSGEKGTTREKGTMKTSKRKQEITLEVHEQNLGRNFGDVAKIFNVSQSTFGPQLELDKVNYSLSNMEPACSDMPRGQAMATAAHMMPHVTTMQDVKMVDIKAEYKVKSLMIRFKLPSTAGMVKLEEEIVKRLTFLQVGCFKVTYLDEENDSILLACDTDLQNYINTSIASGITKIRMFIELDSNRQP